ncbi:NUDIX domain-containing protein [Filobacillus milosensis]|uniref:NUDIX domain-containing protein n=1 Tax=Filobacillus milosensis TaxID=94137 RepID=UPI001E446C88|nr:NUDIX domain-containing protein [Filobacillus milosensis]
MFGQKLKDLNYEPKPRAYAVILNHSKQKVLTVQTSSGHYFLPGGGIEDCESVLTCLERELLEEIGFEIKEQRFIGEAHRYFITRNGKPIINEGRFYLVKLGNKLQEPIEIDHFTKWIDVGMAEDLLVHDHQAWAVHQCL